MENDILNAKIDDEVLRSRIGKLIDEKPAPSYLQRISTNPLASVIVAFLLTGIVGTVLSNSYNNRQKELETQRAQSQKESDQIRDEKQRELDRKREDDRRESDRIRADQQRESDRLYQVRQKDIEFRRTVNQRESDRLKDIRQKDLEERLRIKELIERLDLEIGYRWSQFQTQLVYIADWDQKGFPFRPGKGEKDVKEAIDSLTQSPRGKFSPLYEEFENISTLALIAELRRYVPLKERDSLDHVLADLSSIYVYLDVQKVPISKVYDVGKAIDKLNRPRWRKGHFYFSDCPFC